MRGARINLESPELFLSVYALHIETATRYDVHLDRPAVAEEGLQDLRLPAREVVMDRPGRCEVGSATGLGTLPGLKREDIASHVVVERLGLTSVSMGVHARRIGSHTRLLFEWIPCLTSFGTDHSLESVTCATYAVSLFLRFSVSHLYLLSTSPLLF